MARLDVYPMPGGAERRYVIDVQAKLLDPLSTRVVVPLLPRSEAPPSIGELNPVFDIGGETYVMVTQALAGVSAKELRRPVVSLDSEHDAITRALDILLLGL